MSGDARALWAVVPVKAFARGKSRLGPVLSDPLRTAFARSLFLHVAGTLLASKVISGLIVVTEDDDVREAAEALGAVVVSDPQTGSLADVVDAGLAHAVRSGATAALVSMADLPKMTCEDVQSLARAIDTHDVVITPDLVRAGTNILCLKPADRFKTCFGRADSFAQHLARAAAFGADVHVLEAHGLSFDVDGPEDLDRISQ